MLKKNPTHKNIAWHKEYHSLFKIPWVLTKQRTHLGQPYPWASTGFSTSICVAAHGQGERWHSSALSMVTAQAAQHMGKLHTWTRPEGCRRLENHIEILPQGTGLSTPVLATAETTCFSFPKQAENIRFNGSFLCWKCSKAINCCRFLQSFPFHGRFSTQVLLPVVC